MQFLEVDDALDRTPVKFFFPQKWDFEVFYLMNTRIWRKVAVAPYEDLYQVSNDGLVMRTKSGRILRHAHNERGYPCVGLSANGKPKGFTIHRLMALSFIDASSKLDVNHINGDKTDNRIENLEFVTKAENNAHARKTGLWHPNKGATPNRRTSDATIALIRSMASHRKGAAIARALNIPYGRVNNILSGRTWREFEGQTA